MILIYASFDFLTEVNPKNNEMKDAGIAITMIPIIAAQP